MSSTPKSPNSPSRSLESCFNVALKIYDSFPNATFTPAQIASIQEMSVTSGAFKSLISDLKQYGLLDKVAASEYVIAQCIRDYKISDPEAQKLIRYQCSIHPRAFSDILNSQGNHLPRLEVLEGILTSRHNFNRDKARKTAKALIDSLKWAEVLDMKGNVIVPASSAPSNSQSAGYRDPESNENQNSDSLEAGISSPEQPLPDNALTVDVPLDSGRLVHIRYPQDLNKAEADKVGRVLNVLAS